MLYRNAQGNGIYPYGSRFEEGSSAGVDCCTRGDHVIDEDAPTSSDIRGNAYIERAGNISETVVFMQCGLCGCVEASTHS
jgi:hypothetical protein